MSQQDRKRHRDGTDLDDSTRRGGSAIFQHIKEAAQQPRTSAAPAASAPMSHAERLRAEAAAFAASQRAELPEDEPSAWRVCTSSGYGARSGFSERCGGSSRRRRRLAKPRVLQTISPE